MIPPPTISAVRKEVQRLIYRFLKNSGKAKKICLVPVTCPKKVGRVGREFFLFYLFFIDAD